MNETSEERAKRLSRRRALTHTETLLSSVVERINQETDGQDDPTGRMLVVLFALYRNPGTFAAEIEERTGLSRSLVTRCIRYFRGALKKRDGSRHGIPLFELRTDPVNFKIQRLWPTAQGLDFLEALLSKHPDQEDT